MTKTQMLSPQFCPCCEKDSWQVHYEKEPVLITLGEVVVTISADYWECLDCGGTYDNPRDDYDPLAIAYAEYERITGKKWESPYMKKIRSK